MWAELVIAIVTFEVKTNENRTLAKARDELTVMPEWFLHQLFLRLERLPTSFVDESGAGAALPGGPKCQLLQELEREKSESKSVHDFGGPNENGKQELFQFSQLLDLANQVEGIDLKSFLADEIVCKGLICWSIVVIFPFRGFRSVQFDKVYL